MLKKSTYTFLICLLVGSTLSSANGADFYHLRLNTLVKERKPSYLDSRITAEVINKIENDYINEPSHLLIFPRGKDLFGFSLCRFELFQIQGDSFEQKYKFYNRGYTCSTVPFVRDSAIYLLGGNGLWTAHADLMLFDEVNGSWEYTYTENQPLDYHSEVFFQNSKGVYLLFGRYQNLRRKFLQNNFAGGYFLDWKTKTWKKLRIHIDGGGLEKDTDAFKFKSFETKDYLFFVVEYSSILDNIGWNIIDKKTGLIYHYPEAAVDYFTISGYAEVLDNIIYFRRPDGKESTVDVEQMIRKSKQVGYLEEVSSSSFAPFLSSWGLRDGIYLSLVGAMLGGFGWMGYRYKSKKGIALELSNEPNEVDVLIYRMLVYSGEQVDAEQFDVLLGIDALPNIDSKRLKRSRLITKVNEYYQQNHGKELITRVKNPDDKRYVYYRIDR